MSSKAEIHWVEDMTCMSCEKEHVLVASFPTSIETRRMVNSILMKFFDICIICLAGAGNKYEAVHGRRP